jgi:acyl carrier protein
MLVPASAFDRLVTILTDDFQVPRERVTREAHLRTDLGLDSLSLTDLAFLVQRDFGFKTEAEGFRGVTTVGALADFCSVRTTIRDTGPAPRGD